MSSIDNVHLQETAEESAEVVVDGSAGSDTDTGGLLKPVTASKDNPEVPHHARSNSVKKPTSFKPLSVTKNFLAKAGTPTAAAAKTNGDSGKARAPDLVSSRNRLTMSSCDSSIGWRHCATGS